MRKVYLFNPENDMALGCGDVYYQPTAIVRRMAEDLSALPLWYAEEGACVLSASACSASACMSELSLRPRGVELVSECPQDEAFELVPWGWNPALVHRMEASGLCFCVGPDTRSCVPTSDYVDRIKRLSSRKTAVEVLRRMVAATQDLASGMPKTDFTSTWLTSMDEVNTYIYKKECVLKAPWSGSGRGVYFLSAEGMTASQRGWAERILRTQGAVVGEPRYRGVQDFAMEFRVDAAGEVAFVGYSWFETDGQGAYKGNLLASDEEIERRLMGYVPLEELRATQQRLTGILKEALHGEYAGFLGVDMMICEAPSKESDARSFALHPCIEINLRMNMGLVAHIFYDRYVAKGKIGQYVVSFSPKKGEIQRRHAEMQAENPCVVKEERVEKGYLSLTPVTEQTKYQAYVMIE